MIPLWQSSDYGDYADAWEKIQQQDPDETFFPGYSYAVADMFESNLPKVVIGERLQNTVHTTWLLHGLCFMVVSPGALSLVLAALRKYSGELSINGLAD